MRRTLFIFIALLLANIPFRLSAQELIGSNQFFSKGGMGIVYQGVYIVVGSAKNELKLNGRQAWIGANRDTTEVVFIQNGHVIENLKSTKDFDLSKCLVVSFQPDRVLFFDFASSKGGYYLRL